MNKSNSKYRCTGAASFYCGVWISMGHDSTYCMCLAGILFTDDSGSQKYFKSIFSFFTR